MVPLTAVIVQDLGILNLKQMARTFSVERGFVLIGCPGNLEEVFSYCRKYDPCVLICDRPLIESADPVRLSELLRHSRMIRILVRVEDADSPELENLLLLGCFGFIRRQDLVHCRP